MRTIKFRAFDTKEKEMLFDIIGVSNCSDNRVLDAMGVYLFEDFLDNGRYEVMQYTGLQDKNNSEIYEGDILKYTTRKRKYYSVVEFDKHLERWSIEPFTPMNVLLREGQVVGNMYENKDLIKKK